MDTTVIVALVGFGGIALGKAVDILIDRLKRKDSKQDKEQAKHDEVMDAIKSISGKVDTLQIRLDETAAVQCRVRILRFADEISHGVAHTKEHWMQTMEDIRIYDKFADSEQAADFRNGITTASENLIRECYEERLKNNDFL